MPMQGNVSRTSERKDWPQQIRMGQAEADLDAHDRQFELLWERNNKLLWVLISFVVSFASAAVLLALNLVTKA